MMDAARVRVPTLIGVDNMANGKRDKTADTTADTASESSGTDVAVRASNLPAAPNWEQLNMVDERMSDDELRDIGSIEDVVAAIGEPLVDASDVVGNGFLPLDDKGKLVDVPMILVQWRFTEGDYTSEGAKTPYVTVFALTRHGERFRFTDGGAGICAQLIQATVRLGRTKGLALPNGLRVSEYNYTDPNTGDESPAKTYYLNV